MKNPFKQQSIMDTIVNVGIGGAANVAFDAVVNQFDVLKSLGDTTINAIKIATGAVVGSMVKNDKVYRAACDGIATVGVSNLIAGLVSDATTSNESTNGLPYGTIGRVRPGVAAYKRAHSRKVSGVNAGAVMGK